MTAVVSGLVIAALSPFFGVQLFGVIVAPCGAAWVWAKSAEADA